MELDSIQEIKIGDGMTELCHSDRHAHTIIDIIDAKTIVVQQDRAVRMDDLGMSEVQSYTYTKDPMATEKTLTLRKNGYWHQQGRSMKDSNPFITGIRREYHDFSF